MVVAVLGPENEEAKNKSGNDYNEEEKSTENSDIKVSEKKETANIDDTENEAEVNASNETNTSEEATIEKEITQAEVKETAEDTIDAYVGRWKSLNDPYDYIYIRRSDDNAYDLDIDFIDRDAGWLKKVNVLLLGETFN